MPVSPRHRRAPARLAPREKGVTLIIALIMLVIIGLASVSLMRNSLNTDLVANSGRSQELATQAAQIALRYCETQIQQKPVVIAIQAAATPPVWQTWTNWTGAGKLAIDIPDAVMQSANSSFLPAYKPQCLAEWSNTPAGSKNIIVTARGFSPDYAESAGRTTAGSVVWLQSFLLVS